MKPTQFTLEVLHNLGNYENVKFSVTYQLDKNEQPNFGLAKQEIEKQWQMLYCKKAEPEQKTKPTIEKGSQLYHKIGERLANKTATMQQVLAYYTLSEEVAEEWNKYQNTNN